MERQEWLELRRGSIGGSDAAAIMGLNPWSTPYTVWADKTGRLPEKPDNEAMRQGRDLEQYVAERFTEATGKRCRRKTAMLRNPAYPFAHANIDRWIVGENAGLECKTTSILNLKRFKNGEYPESHYCQCVHYMAVTGADRWYLAVLVLNQGFYHYVIERDEAEITALMKAEKEFWRYVEEDAPPPVDGLPATSEALATIYADSIDNLTPVELFGREKVIREYLEIKDSMKDLEQRKELCEQQLKADLGEEELGQCGNYLVKWKKQTRSNFDVKAFAKENPGIGLEDYYNVASFRKFEVKERKEA